MTRINLIDPQALADQHVMAEYRELPMVMASLRRTLKSKTGWQASRVSKQYTLNAGHVYFFTNKKQFLIDRFNALVDELRFRGYDISPESRNIDWTVFDYVPQISWQPSRNEKTINISRLIERVKQKPDWYRWTKRPRTWPWELTY